MFDIGNRSTSDLWFWKSALYYRSFFDLRFWASIPPHSSISEVDRFLIFDFGNRFIIDLWFYESINFQSLIFNFQFRVTDQLSICDFEKQSTLNPRFSNFNFGDPLSAIDHFRSSISKVDRLSIYKFENRSIIQQDDRLVRLFDSENRLISIFRRVNSATSRPWRQFRRKSNFTRSIKSHDSIFVVCKLIIDDSARSKIFDRSILSNYLVEDCWVRFPRASDTNLSQTSGYEGRGGRWEYILGGRGARTEAGASQRFGRVFSGFGRIFSLYFSFSHPHFFCCRC